MDIADPNFLVAKPKKERTPAQVAATEKGLAALKARRNELSQKVTKLKEKGPAPVKPVKPVAKPVAAPVVAVEEESSSEEDAPAPPPAPVAKKAKSVPAPVVAPVAPPQFDQESLISAISLRVTESLASKKKPKRVIYESSSEEEVVIVKKPKEKAAPVPVVEPPKPRPMPAHFAKSAVLSRLFSL